MCKAVCRWISTHRPYRSLRSYIIRRSKRQSPRCHCEDLISAPSQGIMQTRPLIEWMFDMITRPIGTKFMLCQTTAFNRPWVPQTPRRRSKSQSTSLRHTPCLIYSVQKSTSTAPLSLSSNGSTLRCWPTQSWPGSPYYQWVIYSTPLKPYWRKGKRMKTPVMMLFNTGSSNMSDIRINSPYGRSIPRHLLP